MTLIVTQSHQIFTNYHIHCDSVNLHSFEYFLCSLFKISDNVIHSLLCRITTNRTSVTLFETTLAPEPSIKSLKINIRISSRYTCFQISSPFYSLSRFLIFIILNIHYWFRYRIEWNKLRITVYRVDRTGNQW